MKMSSFVLIIIYLCISIVTAIDKKKNAQKDEAALRTLLFRSIFFVYLAHIFWFISSDEREEQAACEKAMK